MPVYANLSRKSNVVFFNVMRKPVAPSIGLGGGAGSLDELVIEVEFGDGSIYGYSETSAGAANVQTMIRLANKGSGLNSFIMKQVRKRYAYKR